MAKKQVPPKSFEEGLAELEAILADIEAGEVPLEQSLVKYERGQFLVQHCRNVLSQAEKQIELLGKGPDGESLQATPIPDPTSPGSASSTGLRPDGTQES